MDEKTRHIRTCYDAVARKYAERFIGELAHKPLDRELLRRFASEVGARGLVYDVGCGPGQTTAFLRDCSVSVHGLDLSAELVREARQIRPDIEFQTGDMLALPLADGSVAGVVAFYAIVHFSVPDLRRAIGEMYRVLQTGGRLLLAFHVGNESIHVDEFLGHSVSLDFQLFTPSSIASELTDSGFVGIEVIEREPYPQVEYPSRRAYVFARKPDTK